MQELLRQAQIVAGSTSTVLLQGESGTGKELLARVIHAESGRGARPFVSIDCSALSEKFLPRSFCREVFEGELLGHVIGEAPFASPAQTGLLSAGHGGTVFLDDIGNMPLRLQARLLRFLQDRGVRPSPMES